MALIDIVCENLNGVKRVSNYTSFKYGLDKQEFLSSFLLGLCVANKNRPSLKLKKKQFWMFINVYAKNRALFELRGIRRRKKLFTSNICDLYTDDFYIEDYQPDYATKEFATFVVNYLKNGLKIESHKIIFDMFFLQQMSFNDIQEEVNLPVGTIKDIIHRVRVKARKKIIYYI